MSTPRRNAVIAAALGLGWSLAGGHPAVTASLLAFAAGLALGSQRRSTAAAIPAAPPPNRPTPDAGEHAARELERRRLALFQDVARTVGHDFNNLLTSIIGFCDLAEGAATQQTAIQEDLEQVRAAARRGALLVRRLHAFERPESDTPRGIDEAVAGLVDAAADCLPRTVQLAAASSAAPEVVAQPTGAVQETVLVELLRLARETIGDRGRITLGTEADALQVRIHCHATAAGTLAGGGLPDADALRALLRQHGGHLASRDGTAVAKATLTVTLPRAAVTAQPKHLPTAVPRPTDPAVATA